MAPQEKFADVNGVKLHYRIAGTGDPIVLLHGFAETSHMWLPLIAKLSDKHTVIAPDLRGFGQSSAPAVEEEVMTDVASYGKQLGRVEEALLVLLDTYQPNRPLSAAEDKAIEALRSMVAKVEDVKKRHRRP